jgi:hypothetical protein
MNSIYSLTAEYKALMAEIEANEGELTEESAARLDFVREGFEAKASNYAYVIKSFEDNASIIDAEIKRLQAMKKRAENNADRLSDRIKQAMMEFGITKVEMPTIKISFRTSKSVQVEDESLIPKEFMRVKTTEEPNKTEIKKAIEEGKIVTGASIVENINLSIK